MNHVDFPACCLDDLDDARAVVDLPVPYDVRLGEVNPVHTILRAFRVHLRTSIRSFGLLLCLPLLIVSKDGLSQLFGRRVYLRLTDS